MTTHLRSLSSELVMPAGSFEKLKFSFAYGADAVYAGVPAYSLRARDNDFTAASIQEAIEYTHSLGKRIYLTMNIYAHNRKVDHFLDSFCEMADLGPDGFIMTDVGLIDRALKLRPDSPIHLSTQANATNWAAVEFWKDLGIRRIVLSRELSLREIGEIHQRVPDIELEAFVHGSICIAYSGRCLISNYLNHRDANQGTCTNSCRWSYALSIDRESLVEEEAKQAAWEQEYEPLVAKYLLGEAKRSEKNYVRDKCEIDEDEFGTYLMNSKDLCAIELLEELCDSGVSAFKVEGRTKSIYYAAVIARAYRRAIDDLNSGCAFNPDNLREVASTSTRTLMTGFLKKPPREYGENFEDGDSLTLTHRCCGRVKDFDALRGLALVEFKNKVREGESVEWITPKDTVVAKVEVIQKPNGAFVREANGGLVLGVNCPFEADSFTLLRQACER